MELKRIKESFLDKPQDLDYSYKLAWWLHNKYLKKKGRLLDAGCGTGTFLLGWNKLGYEVEGCDIYPKHKEIKKADLNKKWPYPNESFDYIFMWHVCEHLTKQEWFSEALRILKKKGKIIIGTPDWKTYYKRFYDTYTHYTPYTIPLFYAISKEMNFKVNLARIFSNIPILWKYTPKAFNFIMPFKYKYVLTILEKIK